MLIFSSIAFAGGASFLGYCFLGLGRSVTWQGRHSIPPNRKLLDFCLHYLYPAAVLVSYVGFAMLVDDIFIVGHRRYGRADETAAPITFTTGVVHSVSSFVAWSALSLLGIGCDHEQGGPAAAAGLMLSAVAATVVPLFQHVFMCDSTLGEIVSSSNATLAVLVWLSYLYARSEASD